MAYYNPRTDKIMGCKRGSYAWEHENRHRDQYKKGIAHLVDNLHLVWYNIAFLTGSGGFVFDRWHGLFIGIGLAMFPHILGLAYLEGDAYLVGLYRWIRLRRRHHG